MSISRHVVEEMTRPLYVKEERKEAGVVLDHNASLTVSLVVVGVMNIKIG